MLAPENGLPPGERRTLICLSLGFFCLVLGSRLLCIAWFGNPTPFWDQWDSEASTPLKPWLEGHLTWGDMLAGHEEHRIFTFRAMALLLLELNHRVWNPLLEMVVDAGLYAVTMTLFAGLGLRLCRPAMRPLFLLGTLSVACLPLDYDNILWGFQSQFYFLILFSLLFLWAVACARPLSGWWWAGMVAGVLATFSMASGVLAPLAGAGLYLVQWLRGERRDRTSLVIAAVLLLATSLVVKDALALSPPVMAVQRPHSIGDVLYSLNMIFTWPLVPLVPVLCLLLNLPWLMYMAELLRERRAVHDPAWVLVAGGLWVILQFAALAYARGVSPLLSRYKDVIVMGPLLNLLCLAALPTLAGWRGWLQRRLVLVWPVLLVLGLALAAQGLGSGMTSRHDTAVVQEKRLHAYLAEGKPLQVDDLVYFSRPFPSSSDLKGYLDDPTIHAMLPPNILPRNATRQPRWVTALLAFPQDEGVVLLLTGATLLVLALVRHRRTPATG